MAQSLEVGYPSFIGDADRRLPHAPDTSVSDRTPRKVKQRSKLTTTTNILTSFSIALGSYGCAVGPAGFVEAANLPPNPIVTLTGMPDSATGIAETPTPQEGVQEPTFVDVPFLLPTDIVPSLTPLTPESSLTPTLTQTATEIQPSATVTSTATQEASPTPDGLWCNKEDKNWESWHQFVTQELEKNPDKTPVLNEWLASIAHFVNASPPYTQQCIGTSSKNSIAVSALKNWGFSDSQIETCRQKNIEPFLEKNWKDPKLWLIPKNKQWEFNMYVNDKGKEPYTCEYVQSFLTPERRKKLIDLMPKLGLN